MLSNLSGWIFCFLFKLDRKQSLHEISYTHLSYACQYIIYTLFTSIQLYWNIAPDRIKSRIVFQIILISIYVDHVWTHLCITSILLWNKIHKPVQNLLKLPESYYRLSVQVCTPHPVGLVMRCDWVVWYQFYVGISYIPDTILYLSLSKTKQILDTDAAFSFRIFSYLTC